VNFADNIDVMRNGGNLPPGCHSRACGHPVTGGAGGIRRHLRLLGRPVKPDDGRPLRGIGRK
jgi:hypothetical protein